MTNEIVNLFWDSCLFCRYLIGSPSDFVEDISDYLRDAKRGKYVIHYSTIAIAEIKPSHLKNRNYGNFQDFLDDFEGAFLAIEATPQVMIDTAALRDVVPINPNKPASRVLSMADALQLASCSFADRVMCVKDITFHTLDKNPGEKAGEKTIPIIGMEDWYSPDRRNRQLERACLQKRELPHHPQRRLHFAAQ